jgi:hypothetical protein
MRCSLTSVRGVVLLAMLFGWARGSPGALRADDTSPPKKTPERAAVSPSSSACRIATDRGRCSGTVLAGTKTTSLVVSCNHCFAVQPFPGAPFPRAAYPRPCRVTHLESGVTYDGTAVDGDEVADISLVVVGAGLPVARVETGKVAPGSRVEHFGITSGHATGTVLFYTDDVLVRCSQTERARIASIPGDSGAGLFIDGKYVACNWGNWSKGVQAGTGVHCVSSVVRNSGQLARMHADLWGSYLSSVGLPLVPVPSVPVPDPAPIVKPAIPRPVPPSGRVLFPRLRKLIGR